MGGKKTRVHCEHIQGGAISEPEAEKWAPTPAGGVTKADGVPREKRDLKVQMILRWRRW